jgi:hypothetical protein
MKEYIIKYSTEKPSLNGNWDDLTWLFAETAELKSIRPESDSFAPSVMVKLLYNEEGISGIFHVQDRYVVCKRTKHMEQVWRDSCAEFFVKPGLGKGYFNFEFNCIGILHASYITNPARNEGGFREHSLFTLQDCQEVKTCTSLKKNFENEIKEPIIWTLQFFIPFALIAKYAGQINRELPCDWACNFNKCADDSSHPHWITWAPIKELNFHAPESFGKLTFEKR